MLARSVVRWISLAALGGAGGCAAPPPDDGAALSDKPRSEVTARARSALNAPRWTAAPSCAGLHEEPQVAVLHDGRIFVTGWDDQYFPPEIYDPTSDRWTVLPAPPQNHEAPSVAFLEATKQVLVVGSYTTQADLYDLETGTWLPGALLSEERDYPVSVPLLDGRALVVGSGIDESDVVSTADVFDPKNGTFTPVGSLSALRSGFSATRLLDGRVLIAGGFVDYADATTLVEIFDPATGLFEPGAPLLEPRTLQDAVLLPGGQVLIFGGYVDPGHIRAASAELYDPMTDIWEAVPPMSTPRLFSGSAFMPALERVVVSGGDLGLGTVESFDPVSLTWLEEPSMTTSRFGHRLALLPQGWLMAIGGMGGGESLAGLSSNETFSPLGTACTATADCGPEAYCADGVCCTSACKQACHTCAEPTSLGRCKPQGPGEDLRGDCNVGCDAACNGSGVCSFIPVDTPCFAPKCSDDFTHLLSPLLCGGNGMSCASDEVEAVDCAPYRCGTVDGEPKCKAPCASLSDCLQGFVCDLEGECVPPPPLETAGGCSLGTSPPEPRFWLLSMAFGLMLILRRGIDRARRALFFLLACALGLSACAGPVISPEPEPPRSLRPAGPPEPVTGAKWQTVASPEVRRDHAKLITLAGGSVLAIGGCVQESLFDCAPTSRVDLFEPAERQWQSVKDLPYLADHIQAVTLDDGRVLVAGGWTGSGATAAAAIYDSDRGDWVSASPMSRPRWGHAMARLPDGRALVAGGAEDLWTGTETAEIYDPATDAWSPAPPMARPRAHARAAPTSQGDVVVIGATLIYDSPNELFMADPESTLAERFDIQTQTWSTLPAAQQKRWAPEIMSLSDGRLLVMGGLPFFEEESELFAEVLDPDTGQWSPVKGKDAFPFENFTTTRLPSGRALIGGGLSSRTWLFDPETLELQVVSPMLTTHAYPGAALIPGVGVLIFDNQIPELFTALGTACAPETDCVASLCIAGTCCSPGCECGTCSPNGCSVLGAAEKVGRSLCQGSCIDATHAREASPCGAHSPECLYEVVDCVAYLCDEEMGGCRTDCRGPADCAEGFACTVEGRCVAPPPREPPRSGCGLAPAEPVRNAGAPILATLAIGLFTRRRRATRVTRSFWVRGAAGSFTRRNVQHH